MDTHAKVELAIAVVTILVTVWMVKGVFDRMDAMKVERDPWDS